MSFNERDRLLVIEIMDSTSRIFKYTKKHTAATFIADQKTQDAVSLSLIRIGEACGKLSDDAKALADIPWPQYSGLRNRIAHNYTSVDHSLIWSIIEEDLDDLCVACDRILKSIS